MAFRQNQINRGNPVFPGHEVQIGNFPPVPIEELRREGIHWSHARGLGFIPTNLPLASTQADRDRFIAQKKRTLNNMEKLAKITLVFSVLAILVGAGTIYASAPDFNFPHVMGGAIITGVMGLLQAWQTFKLVTEARITLSEDTSTSRFRRLGLLQAWQTFKLVKEARITLSEDTSTLRFRRLYACKVFTVIAALYFTFAPAVGISGIWGIVDCNKEIDDWDTSTSTSSRRGRGRPYHDFSQCVPNTTTLLALAALALVLGIIVYGLIISMCCSITCNARALGNKSNYERFYDYMNQRMRQNGQQSQIESNYGIPSGLGQQTYGVNVPHGVGQTGSPIYHQPTTTVTGIQHNVDCSRFEHPPPPPTYHEIINA